MTTEWKELPTIADVAKAKADGLEIEIAVSNDIWELWEGNSWFKAVKYRARPRQLKVKMICWIISGKLEWLQDGLHNAGPTWIRVPSEDKEIEVPDDN